MPFSIAPCRVPVWIGQGILLLVLVFLLQACALSGEEKEELFTKEWVPFEYIHPQKTAVINGNRVAYVDVGRSRRGSTPILLIHGLAATLNNWEFVIDDLAKKRRVIALDLPGHGNSDKPAGDYTMPFFAETVVGLMDHLRIKKEIGRASGRERG